MSKRFTFITLALSSSVAFLVGVILAGGVARTPVVSSAPVRELRDARPAATGARCPAVGELRRRRRAHQPGGRQHRRGVEAGAAGRRRGRPRGRRRSGRRPARARAAAPGRRQRLHRRSQRLHPDELPRRRGRRAHHRDAGGRPRVSRHGRRLGSGDRRRARAHCRTRRTCPRRRSAIPTSCAPASGSAPSAIRSATCTR